MIRGIRGATTVESDTEMEVISAVEKLMAEIIQVNEVDPDMVASVFFSATEEIRSVFPAKALRKFEGWTYVPVTCMKEIPVSNSLPFCIRVMIHVNTTKSQKEIQHVYQAGATVLRPDLTKQI
ncbi:chorismate mutase [Peribacillus frigoritolerans]|uniref:chorismate mutase n=1 Tax=Peribacillus frigoritolerans TaxID=450367 RepID=A0A561DME1_9BACI|nr:MULTISPECIES: chorismate mutase [Peribacillus]MBD8136365.1 chorismate mutase [Bacillus sp. CFBP 13597]MDP9740324.1 chorismate mutase [Bacillus sp. B2I3]PAW27138.1 chorismate mutase [Peribacillus simplex]PEF35167.1 chorismate mutase [Bacillus sp. AFS094228]PHD74814.1 chorismate mutase [Bacillus sp. AFS043905]PRS38784.1 chorismate mutase [Bacillus sp. RJGP41]